MINAYIVDSDAQESQYYGDPVEPVSLAEAKKHLIVTFDDDDQYITDLISQARQSIESYIHCSIVRKFVTALIRAENRLRLSFGWQYNQEPAEVELPYGPVVGDVDVTDVSTAPGGVSISGVGSWEIQGFQFKKILVTPGQYLLTYEVGYQSSIPRDLKRAILEEIAFRYENRGDSTNKYAHQNIGICAAAQQLANTYMRVTIV